MTTDSKLSDGLTRPVFWIGMLYALIGVLNYSIFAIFGSAEGVVGRVPIDLLPYFGILVLLLAIRADMGQKTLQARLTALERVCLMIVVVAIGFGLAVTAVDTTRAVDGLVIRLPHIAFAVGLYYLLCQAGRMAALWVTGAIALQTLLHMPIVIGLYVTNVDNPMVNWLGGPTGYWHVRIWGMVLAAGLAAALGLYAARPLRGPLLHVLAGLVFVALWTALFWSGTRSGAVGVVAATLFSVAFLPSAFLRAMPVFLGSAAIAAAISMVLILPTDAYGLVQAIGGRDNGLEGVDGLSGGRMRMWLGVLGQLGDHPIFGHGFDQYKVASDEASKHHVQPHNAILQLLFDFGYVGGGAALALLGSLWLRAITPVVREQQVWKYGAMTALHTVMVIAMFDGGLYHHDPLAIAMVCFAVLFSKPRQDRTA